MDVDPRHPRYIATQGPLSNTVDNFWQVRLRLLQSVQIYMYTHTVSMYMPVNIIFQMIWEQNIAVIVMLTSVTDMGLVSY